MCVVNQIEKENMNILYVQVVKEFGHLWYLKRENYIVKSYNDKTLRYNFS